MPQLRLSALWAAGGTRPSRAEAPSDGGLNFRELAKDVGIKHASLYYHFATKADLGAAVARRYWEDASAALEALSAATSDPFDSLRRYPETFRRALEADNRMCLASFMAAEFDDLPHTVKTEIQTFADINVAWLKRMLSAAGVATAEQADQRARAIFAAVAGAQLVSRSRVDVAVYDALIEGYRSAGLLPA